MVPCPSHLTNNKWCFIVLCYEDWRGRTRVKPIVVHASNAQAFRAKRSPAQRENSLVFLCMCCNTQTPNKAECTTLGEQRVLTGSHFVILPFFYFVKSQIVPAVTMWCTQKRIVLNRSVPERLPRWCILVNKVLMTLSNGQMNTEGSNQRQRITCFFIFHISLKKIGFPFSCQSNVILQMR